MRTTLAAVLGVTGSKVTCITERAGGGFGGKLSRNHPIACAAAVAAKKLRVPVRLTLDRNTDIIMTGKRHAYEAIYSVGFDANGVISARSSTCPDKHSTAAPLVWSAQRALCGARVHTYI